MRVRFFNTYEPVSTFYRELVPYLSERGIESQIVISRSEYRSGRGLEEALAPVPGVTYAKTTSLGFQAKKGGLSKAMTAAFYSAHAGLYSALGPRADVNVFLTQPPFFALCGHLLSKVRGQPYCCVVMDVFPQEMVEFGLLKRDSTLTRVLYRVSSRAFRHAAAVIVIGRCMADRVAAMGVSRDRIHFIPNWVDERKLHPVEASANRVRADYGWQGKCVILYGGNVGNAQYFEDFVEVAGQMRELPDLLFAIVGDGSRRAEIESRVRSKGLDNLVMLPFLHDKYPLSDILAAADVHFISLREACTGLGVPSKTYAALAVGRPVIYQGSPEGEIARMITEESIGEVVRPGAVSELRAVVAAYHGDRERRRREGARARALAEGKYGHQRALEQYANLFERVAGRQRGAT